MGKRVRVRPENVRTVSWPDTGASFAHGPTGNQQRSSTDRITRFDVLVHELALLISMSCRAEVWRTQKAEGEA